MECVWCGHKPCVCHDTVEDAKTYGIGIGSTEWNKDNPYSTNTQQYLAFKEGVDIGNKQRIQKMADHNWSTDEVYESIQSVTKEEDPLKRLEMAARYIVYYSAYLRVEEHSKYSAVCADAALSPETYRTKEE